MTLCGLGVPQYEFIEAAESNRRLSKPRHTMGSNELWDGVVHGDEGGELFTLCGIWLGAKS